MKTLDEYRKAGEDIRGKLQLATYPVAQRQRHFLRRPRECYENCSSFS